jgi:VWFA-related protein
MAFTKLSCALFVSLLPATLPVAAQQSLPPVAAPAPSSSSQQIHLDVVVDSKSGQPVNYLGRQDFTILDNKTPRPITSFKVVTAAQEPVTVILFIDAVNTPYNFIAFLRNSTESFLKKNEGVLTHATGLAVLTDDGVQLPTSFSTNGMALSDDLEHRQIGLRQITDSSQWGGSERFLISIKALHQLTLFAAKLPGRKIILWISPGFPLVSGPSYSPLTFKAEEAIFDDVTYFSSELRQEKITLYNIDPVGTTQSTFSANYYQTFIKGVTKPVDAQLADLSVQVLSTQTGGLALVSNNDIEGMIQKCIADADSWYDIAFDPPPAEKPNQYHRIEVRLDQPGLSARTRTGYYSNPLAANTGH